MDLLADEVSRVPTVTTLVGMHGDDEEVDEVVIGNSNNFPKQEMKEMNKEKEANEIPNGNEKKYYADLNGGATALPLEHVEICKKNNNSNYVKPLKKLSSLFSKVISSWLISN